MSEPQPAENARLSADTPSSRSMEKARGVVLYGPQTFALFEINDRRVASAIDAAIAEEREKVAAFMLARSIATGHGDTIEDLLSELYGWAIEKRASHE